MAYLHQQVVKRASTVLVYGSGPNGLMNKSTPDERHVGTEIAKAAVTLDGAAGPQIRKKSAEGVRGQATGSASGDKVPCYNDRQEEQGGNCRETEKGIGMKMAPAHSPDS